MTPSIKPVRRLTGAFVREKGSRPLVATLHGALLLLRPKGLRTEEVIDLSATWYRAVKERVARQKAERRAARKKA